MPTVMRVIERLLPRGTMGPEMGMEIEDSSADWTLPPLWPPDVFAVAATLVSMSGCYAHADSSRLPGDYRAIGQRWRSAEPEEGLPHEVAALWTRLLDAKEEDVCARTPAALPEWCVVALELMAIADEASAGIGFDSQGPFSRFFSTSQWKPLVDEGFMPGGTTEHEARRRLTATTCRLVPADECCVQPKARTPQVGCTLRSLSHHLALLPPMGEVTTRWLAGPPTEPQPSDGTEPMNLLLVPYPYWMDGRVFTAAERHATEGWGRFGLRQTWLPGTDAEERAYRISSFLLDLVTRAKAVEVDGVHGLVMPELALDRDTALRVRDRLARESSLELFVSGVFAPSDNELRPQNRVHCALMQQNGVLVTWEQTKHHRWKLEGSQIARYHLGHTLDPGIVWWEDIDITNREVFFYRFRPGASLVVLICEDLARIDPVQPIVRAVGPNLVISLLMDGPQVERRWPGRYATVLAEDPGSSVLSFTSLGSVRRFCVPGEEERREVALWKDSVGQPRELKLPKGAHALLLTLSLSQQEERTLDRRSDEGNTFRISLSGVRAIRHPTPPAWIDEGYGVP